MSQTRNYFEQTQACVHSSLTQDSALYQEEQAGEEEQASTAVDTKPKLAGESSYGPDDMTCAICLEQIQLEDTAYVKGCEHAYCGGCIYVQFAKQSPLAPVWLFFRRHSATCELQLPFCYSPLMLMLKP